MTPTAVIEVGGSRSTVHLTTTIDTGFSEAVCLPTPIAVELGLELRGTTKLELADGTEKEELRFMGFVRFLGRRRKVDIYLTDSEEALIGTALLADCLLTIDYPAGTVRISRAPKRNKR